MTSARSGIKYSQKIKHTKDYIISEDHIKFNVKKINIINREVMKGSIKICTEGHIRKVMISNIMTHSHDCHILIK